MGSGIVYGKNDLTSDEAAGRGFLAVLAHLGQDGWRRHIAAVLLVAAATAIRWALNDVLGQSSPFIIFTVPVVAAALLGGRGPGLTATFVAAFAGIFFWVGPRFTPWPTTYDELIHGIVFLVVGVSISWLAGLFQSARRAAEDANQSKDRFLAVLSHELRQPLAPLLTGLALLEKDARLPDDARADLRMMRRNIDLESRMIDDLLDVNRIARGKIELRRAVLDVHELLAAALRTSHGQIERKRLNVRLELRAARHHVMGDAVRIEQVFWNLLRNAVKFTPDDGRIDIRSSNESDTIRVEVADSGIGIAPEALPRIFDAFEQGGASITRQFGGLGLGLAICKALVGLHGGSIQAFSEGPGRGATFRVELHTVAPAQAPADQPTPDLPASRPERRLRILVVEDHADTANLFARLLGSLGYEVQCAGAVQDALQSARASDFDLVISDLGLPDGSVLELMRALRKQYHVKGICLSGYGMDEDIRRSREAGFAEHLTKPVDVQALQAAIERAMHSS